MKNVLFANNEVTIEFENGIVIGTFKVEFCDLETVRRIVEYRLNATERKSYPLIGNIVSIKKITKEARDFLASKEGCEGITVFAILINSPIGSMIGNFWLRINKPLVPTRIFTNEEEAKKWLKQYIK